MATTGNLLTEGWTAAERTEYARLHQPPGAQPIGSAIPPLVRETLHALRDETPDDEDLSRALQTFDGGR